MLVCDPAYILALLPLAGIFYAAPPGQWRVVIILLASLGYYLTFPFVFFPALIYVIAIAYGGGLIIERCAGTRLSGWVSGVVLLACFVPLAFYKYLAPLWADVFDNRSAAFGVTFEELTFPVGLSFYTFAAAGYLADVALGIIPGERRALRVALFCSFFPIVTQGPTPRTSTVWEQMTFKRTFDLDRSLLAAWEILTGAVLKLWFADPLTVSSNLVYSNLESCPPLEKLIATIFFAFAVYADWIGYSRIAIGSARLFGVDFPPNFRQPYLSPTLPEFWRSWNISLIGWFRDYVFTPVSLLFRRYPRMSTSLALFITFVTLGIWHGASWGYLLYGVANGLLVVGSRLTIAPRDRMWRALGCPPLATRIVRVPVTFLIVVLTMILVRAPDLRDALSIYRGIFSSTFVWNVANILRSDPDPRMGIFQYIHLDVTTALIAALIGVDIVARTSSASFFRISAVGKSALYFACLAAIAYHAVHVGPALPFFYFRY